MDLAAPVDAREDEILVVVLDVEPRPAVRDHAAREDLLARGRRRRRQGGVVEDARRAVELGDDDSLGPVDHEGAVVGHDRDFPEVDLLLLHVADRLRALGVVPGDETDRHLEGRGIGHAALQAFLHVVLRLLEGVAHELQRSRVVEVADRKDGREHGLQARVLALLHLDAGLEEPVERLLLDLEQVGGIDDSRNARKRLADSGSEFGEDGLRHECSSPSCVAPSTSDQFRMAPVLDRWHANGIAPSAVENDETRRSLSRTRRTRRGNTRPPCFPLVEFGRQSGASSDRESIGLAVGRSLDVDLTAGLFDLLLDVVGLGLRHAFLDRPSARLPPGPWPP